MAALPCVVKGPRRIPPQLFTSNFLLFGLPELAFKSCILECQLLLLLCVCACVCVVCVCVCCVCVCVVCVCVVCVCVVCVCVVCVCVCVCVYCVCVCARMCVFSLYGVLWVVVSRPCSSPVPCPAPDAVDSLFQYCAIRTTEMRSRLSLRRSGVNLTTCGRLRTPGSRHLGDSTIRETRHNIVGSWTVVLPAPPTLFCARGGRLTCHGLICHESCDTFIA